MKAPTRGELEFLVHTISEQAGQYMERQNLLVRDMNASYLGLEPRGETGLEQALGSSITYRIALGPHQGCKTFILQTLPLQDRLEETVTRPAISEQRLSLTAQVWVRYQLKTSYRDDTTYVMLEPVDFFARLAALVPKPRLNGRNRPNIVTPSRLPCYWTQLAGSCQ